MEVDGLTDGGWTGCGWMEVDVGGWRDVDVDGGM